MSGCATKGDLRDVEGRIQDLARGQDAMLAELQQQGRITADTLRTQSNQLLDFQGRVTQQLRLILEQLDQLAELTGQNQLTIASVRDELANLRGTTRAGATVAQDQEQVVAGSGAVEMYNAAAEHFNRASNVPARIGFQQFIQAYPNDPYVPKARYFLADILVQDERLEDAIQAFEEIPELHPADPEVPRALYRIGLLREELGDDDEARRVLEIVVNSYSDSSVAELAQEALDRLGG